MRGDDRDGRHLERRPDESESDRIGRVFVTDRVKMPTSLLSRVAALPDFNDLDELLDYQGMTNSTILSRYGATVELLSPLAPVLRSLFDGRYAHKAGRPLGPTDYPPSAAPKMGPGQGSMAEPFSRCGTLEDFGESACSSLIGTTE